jgi:hypothetical protein
MAGLPMPSCCAVAENENSFRIERDRRYLVQNRTPRRIEIIDDLCGQLRLPPLAQRVIDGQRLSAFQEPLRRLRQRHEVRVRTYVPPASRGAGVAWLGGLAFLLIAWGVIGYGTLLRWQIGVGALVLAGIALVVLLRSVTAERDRRGQERGADRTEGDVEYGIGGAFYDGNDTARRAKQAGILAAVLVIGAVLPAIAIFVATDAQGFVVLRGGLTVKDTDVSPFVARAIQATYTAVLATFPALMYFQFDRQRIGTLRARWVRAIFQMEPQMSTLADVDAKYGFQIAEASGDSTDAGQFFGGRHSPIVVATILISLGWTVLVLGTSSHDFGNGTELFELLNPNPSAAGMAFLGSYFFAVYLVLRAYFRGDLRPKLYNQVTARLVVVVVVAYLLNVLYSDGGQNRVLWIAAFLAGIVPNTVLRGVGLAVTTPIAEHGWLGGAVSSAFAAPRSLVRIDGIDLYESARLESEGINDVTSLAKTALVSTMINTRLPIERLVDWTDQAILLTLIGDVAPHDDAGVAAPSGRDDRVARLRHIGIRTATDLAAVADDHRRVSLRPQVERILGEGWNGDGAALLNGLARQIDAEPATHYIRSWRDSARAEFRCRHEPIEEHEPPRRAVSERSGNGQAEQLVTGAPGRGGGIAERSVKGRYLTGLLTALPRDRMWRAMKGSIR